MQLEDNVIKTRNDHALDQLFVGKDGAETVVNDDEFNEFLEGIAEKHGMYEAHRLIDRATQKMMKEGVSSSMIKLKWLSPEVRARAFHMLLKENPGEEDRLWEEAERLKIDSERFKIEVGRLMDEEGDQGGEEQEKGEEKEEDKIILPTSMNLPTIKESRGKDIYMDVEIEETGKTKKMKISALEVRKDIRRRQKALGELINTMNDEG
jgi:hypothetical protein